MCTTSLLLYFHLGKHTVAFTVTAVIFHNSYVSANKLQNYYLQYLIHENGMLKKNLCENEEVMQKSQSKIDELNNKLEEFNTSKSYVTASNVASSKIVELSKKLREKNSEVEVLKTKCSKLEKIISHLNKQQSSQIQTGNY